MAFIGIVAGSYCRGEELVAAISGQTKYALASDRLLELVFKDYGWSADQVNSILAGQTPFWNRFSREKERIIAALKVILARLIAEDNHILEGPAALLLPQTIPQVLRVCIIANLDWRIALAGRDSNLDSAAARRRIQRDDKRLLDLSAYLFEKAPFDQQLYDIMIPMHQLEIEAASDLVTSHARGPAVAASPESGRAVQDHLLAMTVNHVLVEAGHDVEVACEHGHLHININRYVLRLEQYEEQLRRLATGVKGVVDVRVGLGSGYRAPRINPLENVEIPPKILLVDDEREFVQTLSERLQARHYPSSVVYNGEEALEFVKKDEPDVMVLDLMMPGIDGIEVLRRLKQERPNIEVIILTGHGSEREERLAAELGAFAYLKKPVNIDLLTRTMNEAYQKANARRSSRTQNGGE